MRKPTTTGSFRDMDPQSVRMRTQFLTDQSGKRVAVVLSVDDYEELMEDVSDLVVIAERRNEQRVTLEEVKQRLIADGLLPG